MNSQTTEYPYIATGDKYIEEAIVSASSLKQLLSAISIFNEKNFVLVDIGASGNPPLIWQEIAPFSYYVGFDPDSRELQEKNTFNFQKFTLIKKVVTDDFSSSVNFFLTSYPFCSSMLQPSPEICQQYSFTEIFDVERRVDFPATRLDEVIKELEIHGIDWLKLDSQGKDLDLFLSINPSTRDRMLAIDVEPGVIPFYEGENTFDEVHKALLEEGFWLSNLNLQKDPRIKQSTRKALSDKANQQEIPPIQFNRLPGSPIAIEARYLRTIEHLKSIDASLQDYIGLWVFALLDEKIGFALDIALHIVNAFKTEPVGNLLLTKTIENIDLDN